MRNRGHFAFLLALVGAIVVGYSSGAFSRTDSTARTQVFLRLRDPNSPSKTLYSAEEISSFQREQAAIVTSSEVLQTAIQRPEVCAQGVPSGVSEPVRWLQERLKVSFASAPGLMRITLNGPEPRELLILLDAIREAYLELEAKKELAAREEFLEQLRMSVIDERAGADKMSLAAASQTRKHDSSLVDTVFCPPKDENEERITKIELHKVTRAQTEEPTVLTKSPPSTSQLLIARGATAAAFSIVFLVVLTCGRGDLTLRGGSETITSDRRLLV